MYRKRGTGIFIVSVGLSPWAGGCCVFQEASKMKCNGSWNSDIGYLLCGPVTYSRSPALHPVPGKVLVSYFDPLGTLGDQTFLIKLLE